MEVKKLTISKENTRTLITMSKKLKKDLEDLAAKENRTFNNLVVTILKEYIKNNNMDEQ